MGIDRDFDNLMDKKPNPDMAMPSDLNEAGVKAYNALKEHFPEFTYMQTGGCKAFYSPEEWKARGELYGTKSALIVVYDGGDLRHHFSMDACYEGYLYLKDYLGTQPQNVPYHAFESLQESLKKAGFYFEECTHWYSAIYPLT